MDLVPIVVLLERGAVVVASGGGGIPVVRQGGRLRGVEAVLDKDLSGELLARAVGAATFVMATDVDHASVWFGSDRERAIERIDSDDLEDLAAEGQLTSGSMGPKVEAAIRFARHGGRAVITSLTNLDRALSDAGTVVERTRERV